MQHTIKTSIIALALVAITSLNLQAGTLEPTSEPEPSMYTLEEIYNQLMENRSLLLSLGGRLSSTDSMAFIPAGEFAMGDAFSEGGSEELPVHIITISAFYMDRYEVTKALWDEVSAWAVTNGYSFGTNVSGKVANHPVHSADWYDAIAWCNARSEREGLTPVYYTDSDFKTAYKTGGIAPFANWSANGYRLPTEAEWEKAARGGVARQRFPWGNTITHSNANYNSSDELAYDTSSTRGYNLTFSTGGSPNTSPVGSFTPNGYGLYDMAGNVSEWCWDLYESSYYANSPAVDPRGHAGPLSNRVLRGGSWFNFADSARVAARNASSPGSNSESLGFRCARSL